MRKELDDLISAYVETAADLFPRVANHLGASLPISNNEWACLKVPQEGQTPDGVRYYKHGYGVAMDDGKRHIDLDVGEKGEIDGFDAWRLFRFAEENELETPFSDHSDVKAAIKEAAKNSDVTFSGYILYFRVE